MDIEEDLNEYNYVSIEKKLYTGDKIDNESQFYELSDLEVTLNSGNEKSLFDLLLTIYIDLLDDDKDNKYLKIGPIIMKLTMHSNTEITDISLKILAKFVELYEIEENSVELLITSINYHISTKYREIRENIGYFLNTLVSYEPVMVKTIFSHLSDILIKYGKNRFFEISNTSYFIFKILEKKMKIDFDLKILSQTFNYIFNEYILITNFDSKFVFTYDLLLIISKNYFNNIAEIYNIENIAKMIEILKESNNIVLLTLMLKLLDDISYGDDQRSIIAVNSGFDKILISKLLKMNEYLITEAIFLFLSNILCCDQPIYEIIDMVFDKDFIETIIQINFNSTNNRKAFKECSYCLVNLLILPKYSHLYMDYSTSIIDILRNLLLYEDVHELKMLAIEYINHLLNNHYQFAKEHIIVLFEEDEEYLKKLVEIGKNKDFNSINHFLNTFVANETRLSKFLNK